MKNHNTTEMFSAELQCCLIYSSLLQFTKEMRFKHLKFIYNFQVQTNLLELNHFSESTNYCYQHNLFINLWFSKYRCVQIDVTHGCCSSNTFLTENSWEPFQK